MSALIPSAISKKVLLVGEYFDEPNHGGIASVLRNYEPLFESFNFVASHRGSSFRSKLLYDLGGLFKMFLILLLNWKIRIVHIHTAAHGSFRNHQYYAATARLLGRKVIMHSHASGFVRYFKESGRKKRSSILRTLNSADRVLVLSQSWKNWFVSAGVSDRGGRIEILNNITPCPEEPFEKHLKDEGRLRLLFLGEIGRRKGIFDVLKAVSDNKERLSGKIELRIGGNNEVQKLLDVIGADGLQDMVKFEGFVSGTGKAELLEWADALVLTSYNEGLPISILEAMSYGNAILSTPVGGIPEVVDESNGVLVRPGDCEGIFSAIGKLSSLSPEEMRRMGESSRRKAVPFYPESVMSHLQEIYSSMLM